MAVNIHNLIAAIVPDYFCVDNLRKKVKEIAKTEGYLKAAQVAKAIEADWMDLHDQKIALNPFKREGIKNPIEQHEVEYDASAQGLEQFYFWLTGYMSVEYKEYEKLIDNFMSSPGSAQFGEIGQRATVMQKQAMEMLQTSGVIIKSILNILYDLKEFKMVLAPYDELKSKDDKIKVSAYLGLKQRWMDMVDIRKGAGSINSMAQQLDFVTLRDAFMVANSVENVDMLDLNERIKRILKIKVSEFLRWINQSEQELRKRFEIEKIYLKNQVNSIKLYARWIKPYLKAAKSLEQRAAVTEDYKISRDLINVFNTTLLELVLIGLGKFKPKLYITDGLIPKSYINIKPYIPITICELHYRTIPERMTQGTHSGYGYRGKVTIKFTSYALTQAEFDVFKKELEKDDIGDLMELIEGSTEKSLAQMQDDIDEFLGDKAGAEKKPEKSEENTNPFSALFSFFKTAPEVKKDQIVPDNAEEKVMRNLAIIKARIDVSKIYSAFKGSYGMPTF